MNGKEIKAKQGRRIMEKSNCVIENVGGKKQTEKRFQDKLKMKEQRGQEEIANWTYQNLWPFCYKMFS